MENSDDNDEEASKEAMEISDKTNHETPKQTMKTSDECDQKPSKNMGKNVCELCDKSFPNQTRLNRHKKAMHEKQNVCEICDKSFYDQRNLIRHKKVVHEKQKYHQCESCDKSYVDQRNLQHHIKTIHEGLKNHKCKFCKKSYGRKQGLKKHSFICRRSQNMKKINLRKNLKKKTPKEIDYYDGENENQLLTEDESYIIRQNAKIIVENMKKQHVRIELSPIKRNCYCFLCDQYYGTKSDYENHMENKHSGLSITMNKTIKENDVKNFKQDESNHPQPSKVEKNRIEYNLPFGWKKIIHKRTSGIFSGKWVDVMIQSPNGKILRKNKELQKYIEEHPESQYDAELTKCSKPPEFRQINPRNSKKNPIKKGKEENFDDNYEEFENFKPDESAIPKGAPNVEKNNTVDNGDKSDDDIFILPQNEYEEKNTDEILKRDIIAEVKEMFLKQRDEKLENLQRENEDLKKEQEKDIALMKKLFQKQYDKKLENLQRKIVNLEKKHENEIGHLKKDVMELKEKLLVKTATYEYNDTLISEETVMINSSDQVQEEYLKKEHENEIEYLKKEVIELKQKLLAKTNEPSQDLIQHIIDAEEDIDSLIIDGVKITPYRGTNDILDLEDVIDTDTVSKNHQKSSILTFFHLAISQDFLLNFALFFLLSDYYCG